MTKIVSGHQPAYLPWLGYFHKMFVSDKFIVMDTVRYSRGWINKNKIKDKQSEIILSVPIFKEDKEKKINEVRIKNSESKTNWNLNHLNSIYYAYKKSKYFDQIFPTIEMIIKKKHIFLKDLCWELTDFFIKFLKIKTKIIKMSEIKFDGKKSELILNHALQTNSQIVFLGENGEDYIDENIFLKKNIIPIFQSYNCNQYKQLSNFFSSKCSILDLIMNEGENSKKIIIDNNVSKDDLISIYKNKFL